MLDLEMSIMLQNGNSEMRLAAGSEGGGPEEILKARHPLGSRRRLPRMRQKPHDGGRASTWWKLATWWLSMYYRSSAQAKWPEQIKDVKTAIRFLRANADKYEIDPDRIGVMGRSAGGHLSAIAGMNTDNFESEEWSEFSSEVQATYDMFGPGGFCDPDGGG